MAEDMQLMVTVRMTVAVQDEGVLRAVADELARSHPHPELDTASVFQALMLVMSEATSSIPGCVMLTRNTTVHKITQ